ncbi:MAG: winged helix-turn-helix domain-containing protein [Nitrososphaerota archaeon]|nr:winged helix-turn-helix domain-containing protein [Candidatus Calditenuaceae archaeon]MDW8073685.1 winged helix-turn-helix domain-containing protein [Nitrososphaerota archaeon]
MRLSTVLLILFLVSAALSTGLWLYIQTTQPPMAMKAEALEPLARAEPPSEGVVFSVETVTPWVSIASWAGVAATLAYKGLVRHVWSKSMFDYSVFRLMVKMRGATTRVKMLKSLEAPMNRYQLAKTLNIDWKTVDRNVELLKSYGLIHEQAGEGGEKLYVLSPQGQQLLELLEKFTES